MKVSRMIASALAFAAITLTSGAAVAEDIYVALGDSFAWGYNQGPLNGQPPGPGGGYFTSFAQFLDATNGPSALQAINLAVPGETTDSYFSGTISFLGAPYPPGMQDAPFRNQSLNTNYTVPNTAQATLFEDLATQAAGNGDTIKYITLQIGGNDILGAYAQFLLNPALQTLTPAERAAIIDQRFQDLANHYTSILSILSAQAPDARIYVLNYPDSFAGLGAANPIPSAALNNAASQTFKTLADAFGATYIDVAGAFAGKEAILTNILSNDGALPNFHPNAAGYQVITDRLIQATAPEPGTFALVAVAGLPAIALIRRRRK